MRRFLGPAASPCYLARVHRISLVSSKGGASKSTLTIAIATEAARRGLRSAIVDLDPQATCRAFASAARAGGHACPDVLQLAEEVEQVLAKLGDAYDLVVIDTPGRESQLGRLAMMLSDVVLVPVQASPVDLWATASTLAAARKAQGLRPNLVVRTVVSRADARRRFTREAVDTLSQTGVEPLTTIVHDRADFVAAIADGQGVTTFAPDSRAAAEVRALVDEVLALLVQPTASKPVRGKGRAHATA